jgi:hypothetical protein
MYKDIKEQICDALTYELKVDAQKKYCLENNLPMFAPEQNKCEYCGEKFWDNISLEECSNKLITGCHFCHQSYCE